MSAPGIGSTQSGSLRGRLALTQADRDALSAQAEAHQDPWVAGQNGGGVGGFGEAGALEVLPDPGVRHRQVDLGVAIVEWVSLDRRGAVVAGELDRAGDEGVRDAHLSVSRAYADAPQRPDRQVIEVRDLAVAGE